MKVKGQGNQPSVFHRADPEPSLQSKNGRFNMKMVKCISLGSGGGSRCDVWGTGKPLPSRTVATAAEYVKDLLLYGARFVHSRHRHLHQARWLFARRSSSYHELAFRHGQHESFLPALSANNRMKQRLHSGGSCEDFTIDTCNAPATEVCRPPHRLRRHIHLDDGIATHLRKWYRSPGSDRVTRSAGATGVGAGNAGAGNTSFGPARCVRCVHPVRRLYLR